jgi:hypothetical protein
MRGTRWYARITFGDLESLSGAHGYASVLLIGEAADGFIPRREQNTRSEENTKNGLEYAAHLPLSGSWNNEKEISSRRFFLSYTYL